MRSGIGKRKRMPWKALHSRTDANAIDTAGRQDGCHKGSNDLADLTRGIKIDTLVHSTARTQVKAWSQGLEAKAGTIPLGGSVLNGTVNVDEIDAKRQDTHKISWEDGTKVPTYTGMPASDRTSANAYNQWLILASRAHNASNKIYGWIY